MTVKEFNPQGTTGEHPTGMFYRSDVTGPDGAHYELLREKQHKLLDINIAKRYLRDNFDVVSIHIIKEN